MKNLTEYIFQDFITYTLKEDPKNIIKFTFDTKNWYPGCNFLRGTIVVKRRNKNITQKYTLILNTDGNIALFLDDMRMPSDVKNIAKKKPIIGFQPEVQTEGNPIS